MNEKCATPPSEVQAPVVLSAKKKSLFALAALAALAFGLEILARILGFPGDSISAQSRLHIHDQAVFDAAVGVFQPAFRGEVAFPEVLRFRVSINAAGLRGPELRATSEPARRILCVGDSTTFGIYVNDDETWPARLQELHPQLELINGGCPGWSTRDALRFCREKALPKLQPAIVLHMVCGNDLLDLRAEDQGKYFHQLARLHPPSLLEDALRAIQRNSALIRLTEFMRDKALAAREEKRPPGQGLGGQPLPESFPPAALEAFALACKDLVAECKKQRSELVICVFPHDPKDHKNPSALESLILEVAAAQGAVTLPIYQDFLAQGPLEKLYHWPHDLHANAAGNARIAKAIHQAAQRQRLPLIGQP